MSDSDEDYMSDKFLASLEGATKHEDVRPGLLFNKTQKRQHEIYKKKQEQMAKKPKTAKEREEELREQGLNTAISSDNIGFKLLAKMGFKPGQGLGKSESGLKEPIKIEVRQGTSGVGRENHIKEKISRKVEHKSKEITQALNEFKAANRERNLIKFLQSDMFKAQKACEELDVRNEVEDPVDAFYWTLRTMKKKLRIDEEDPEEVEEYEEAFHSLITEENLWVLIDYLRSRHLYCMYCGFVATDEGDLKTNCPGPYRNDHDDE